MAAVTASSASDLRGGWKVLGWLVPVAFFVTLLNQMLKVLGLSNASQYVVFGAAIVVGMLISGDRIAEFIGTLLLRPSLRKYIEGDDSEPRPVPAGTAQPTAT